jgi:tRNA(Ile2) C34 agmatinyltransferase TiaS
VPRSCPGCGKRMKQVKSEGRSYRWVCQKCRSQVIQSSATVAEIMSAKTSGTEIPPTIELQRVRTRYGKPKVHREKYRR